MTKVQARKTGNYGMPFPGLMKGKRGLIMRQRGGADGPPASGDSLCLAPPLMTPEATLDRIVQIVGESISAAV